MFRCPEGWFLFSGLNTVSSVNGVIIPNSGLEKGCTLASRDEGRWMGEVMEGSLGKLPIAANWSQAEIWIHTDFRLSSLSVLGKEGVLFLRGCAQERDNTAKSHFGRACLQSRRCQQRWRKMFPNGSRNAGVWTEFKPRLPSTGWLMCSGGI